MRWNASFQFNIEYLPIEIKTRDNMLYIFSSIYA